jgi:hypothetical protein
VGMQISKPIVRVFFMTARYVATVPETLRRHPNSSQPERTMAPDEKARMPHPSHSSDMAAT